jgi:hypothetical protein
MPLRERRPQSLAFNRTIPAAEQLAAFHRRLVDGAYPSAYDFAPVDGNYTDTPARILRWAACKWEIDEDAVRIQPGGEGKSRYRERLILQMAK